MKEKRISLPAPPWPPAGDQGAEASGEVGNSGVMSFFFFFEKKEVLHTSLGISGETIECLAIPREDWCHSQAFPRSNIITLLTVSPESDINISL